MALTRDDVLRVAHLGRLELTAEMADKMAGQLSQVLDYFVKLNELNTDSVAPMSHPGALSNVFRDDLPTPSLTVEEALKNAPDQQGGCFRVPSVIE